MKLTVQLGSTTNLLSAASGDSVEFILKRESDHAVFWIHKEYAPSGTYVLQDAQLVNQDSYVVACMFQPGHSNVTYSSPSSMSNSELSSPTNFPNNVTDNVTSFSVGIQNYDLRTTWSRPSDFADWSDNYTIHLLLVDSLGNETSHQITNTDLIEYTFTGLAALRNYKVGVKYQNAFGSAPSYMYSSFTHMTKRPQAAIITSVSEGDQVLTVNFAADTDVGQDTILRYELYVNDAYHSDK